MDLHKMKNKWNNGAISFQETEAFINALVVDNDRLRIKCVALQESAKPIKYCSSQAAEPLKKGFRIMKKLFIGFIITLLFSSCVALDIAEIFIDPTPVHYAEVQSITKYKDKTTLFFVDGYNYEISNYIYAKPGDKVKIFQEADGTFKAEAE